MIRRRFSVFNLFAALGFLFIISACASTPEGTSGSATMDDGDSSPGEMFEPAPMDEGGISEAPVSSESPMEGLSASDLVDVYFDYDDSRIKQESRATLERMASLLRGASDVNIQIEGHCDERGTNEYNLALGERRARSIKDFLVALGVNSSQLTTISYGEERPSCSETSESCYSKNRRGHFVIR
ncbi:MAG TPA: peptidoglycan-associated lipoprotein Pal [Nitrospiria bacterium]